MDRRYGIEGMRRSRPADPGRDRRGERGARVRMEGIVSVTSMTAEEVQHMEDEGATVPGKKADGSAEVVEFTASGVEMRGRKK